MLQEGSDLRREQLASFLAVPCNGWIAVCRWVHGCLSPGQDLVPDLSFRREMAIEVSSIHLGANCPLSWAPERSHSIVATHNASPSLGEDQAFVDMYFSQNFPP